MMQENNPSYPFIASLLLKHKGKTVVDNGCGRNEFKRIYDPSVIGLEISASPHADVITDGKQLPFKDHSVDTFLSNFVLEHVENQQLYLAEMKRCLTKNGTIILSIPRPLWYFAYFLSPSVWIMPFKHFFSFLCSPITIPLTNCLWRLTLSPRRSVQAFPMSAHNKLVTFGFASSFTL